MDHHHHARASMTSLIVCLAIITLMVGLALSAAHKLTGQINAGSTAGATSTAAVMHDCAGVTTQSVSADETDAQLQAQAAKDQHCAQTAQNAAAQ